MSERRLPVYLLLDVSGSMDGEPIQAVNNGVNQLIVDLRNDPRALDTAWLSVITFGDEAQQVVPLTDLEDFQMPELTAEGCTALGPALSLLCECRKREEIRGTTEHSGDWRPLVFVMTDGEQNEGDFEKGIADFKSMKWGNYALCAAGPEAEVADLQRINKEKVFKLNNLGPGELAKYFKWVTQSIKMQSKKIEEGAAQDIDALGGLESLPPLPADVASVVDDSAIPTDL